MRNFDTNLSMSNRFNQNETSATMWKKECEKLQVP